MKILFSKENLSEFHKAREAIDPREGVPAIF